MIPLHSLSSPGRWTSWRLLQTTSGGSADRLARLALRTKSSVALDALALGATDGTMDHQELRARVLAGDIPQTSRRPTAMAYAAFMAHAFAGIQRDNHDLSAGTELYWALWCEYDRQLQPIHQWAMAQALFLSGRLVELRSVMDQIRLRDDAIRDLRTDLANPYIGQMDTPEDQRSLAHVRWEELLSLPFTAAGLPGLRVASPNSSPAGAALFDGLHSKGAEQADGALVTVIMPTYRPDQGLLTSLASISSQTWKNLEIIVVDDASGPNYDDVFTRAVALDPRARLLRMPTNGGSYIARNAAMSQAQGAFIAFQDADDWSHPERIERQVRQMLDSPETPANLSLAVRAREDLTHQWFGYPSIRSNASSLVLRREVADRLGPFLPVRKGADTEYAERISALIGPVANVPTPLAVTRLRSGSLSRGDFTYQWSTPERSQFRGSYRAWHRALDSPEQARGNSLPFSVPRSFRRGAHECGSRPELLDIIYLDDFSAPPTDEDFLVVGEPSHRVGIWHLEYPENTDLKRKDMHAAWFDATIKSSMLVPVSRTEAVHAGMLVVRDPRVLQTADDQDCAVTVAEIEVHLRPAHLRLTARTPAVDLLWVADICRRWWGRRPTWIPAPDLEPEERDEVAAALPQLIA